jgi:hypothetical protein
MAFAGIRRQASRVEKGEFVMGVVMDFFDAKFRSSIFDFVLLGCLFEHFRFRLAMPPESRGLLVCNARYFPSRPHFPSFFLPQAAAVGVV